MSVLRKIYADNNATTIIHPLVLKKMLPFLKDKFGNASSLYTLGREAHESIQNARLSVASVIGADANEIYFTASGTESDNWAIKGIVDTFDNIKDVHIITSSIEHLAVLNVCKHLEKKGCSVTYLPVDKKGCVDIHKFKNSIQDNTVLVTIMYANNEVGTLQPIKEISEYINNINKERSTDKKIYFHSDAVQAIGKINLNVKDLSVDLMSFSAHKINGPKGVGALYIKKGTKINSLLQGGHHEHKLRAGTENVAGIVGFGEACKIAFDSLDNESKKLKKLKVMLFKGLQDKISEVYLNGDIDNSLPNTLNVSFNYVEGESIIINLDMKGVAVSSGSACTSGSLEMSHVLKAMGLSPVLAQGSIRFSFDRFNTKKDIEYILDVIQPIIERLRKMSPLYKK